MRRVDRAVIRPMHCALKPYIGQQHEKGFFDFGTEMPGFDNHVYCSVVAAEEMAADMGWLAPADAAGFEERIGGLQDELAGVRAELEQAQAHLDAVDQLVSAGYVARKKPGRPKKEEVA